MQFRMNGMIKLIGDDDVQAGVAGIRALLDRPVRLFALLELFRLRMCGKKIIKTLEPLLVIANCLAGLHLRWDFLG